MGVIQFTPAQDDLRRRLPWPAYSEPHRRYAGVGDPLTDPAPAEFNQVAQIIDGTLDDLEVGTEIALTGGTPDNRVMSKGLKHFVRTDVFCGIPIVFMDNHNHALYFWHEAAEKGYVTKPMNVLHVDHHDDLGRAPVQLPADASLREVYEYANCCTNVGSFIDPALVNGSVAGYEWVRSTGDAIWEPLRAKRRRGYILDLDLDFFLFDEPEHERDIKVRAVQWMAERAGFITVATSPLFIDQQFAIKMAHAVFG